MVFDTKAIILKQQIILFTEHPNIQLLDSVMLEDWKDSHPDDRFIYVENGRSSIFNFSSGYSMHLVGISPLSKQKEIINIVTGKMKEFKSSFRGLYKIFDDGALLMKLKQIR